MPLIRAGMQRPPPGFDVIAEKLEVYDAEMRLAVQEESSGVVGQTTRRTAAERGTKRARTEAFPTTATTLTEATVEPTAPIETEGEADAEPAVFAPSEDHHDASAKEEEKEDSSELHEEVPIPPLWRMARINHDRTRYVYEACFRDRSISKDVYDYCVTMQFIDGGLARRWRLPGYERLCCTACGVPGAASVAAAITTKFAHRNTQERKGSKAAAGKHHSDTATCICRVPAAQRKSKHFLACTVCGCTGCCSSDAMQKKDEPAVTSSSTASPADPK